MSRDVVVKTGNSSGVSIVTIVGMGLATYCSWTLNGSVGWAAVHALFNWFYIIYLCAGFGGGLPAGLF